MGLASALLLNSRCGWNVALVERSPRREPQRRPATRTDAFTGRAQSTVGMRRMARCPGVFAAAAAATGGAGNTPGTRASRPRRGRDALAPRVGGQPALEEGVDAPSPTPSKQVPYHSFSRMVVWQGDGVPHKKPPSPSMPPNRAWRAGLRRPRSSVETRAVGIGGTTQGYSPSLGSSAGVGADRGGIRKPWAGGRR